MSQKSSIPRWAGGSFNIGVHKVQILWARVLLGSAVLALGSLAVNEFSTPSAPAPQSYQRVIGCEISAGENIPTLGALRIIEATEHEAPAPYSCGTAELFGQELDNVIDDIEKLVERIEIDSAEVRAVLDEEPVQIDYEAARLADELKAILAHQETLRDRTRRMIEDEE